MASIFDNNKYFIKSEGLFRTAFENLQDTLEFEYVELLVLYGNSLKQIENRAREGEELVRKAKVKLEQIPPWAEMASYAFVPDFNIN